jgi:hypothetical protein
MSPTSCQTAPPRGAKCTPDCCSASNFQHVSSKSSERASPGWAARLRWLHFRRPGCHLVCYPGNRVMFVALRLLGNTLGNSRSLVGMERSGSLFDAWKPISSPANASQQSFPPLLIAFRLMQWGAAQLAQLIVQSVTCYPNLRTPSWSKIAVRSARDPAPGHGQNWDYIFEAADVVVEVTGMTRAAISRRAMLAESRRLKDQ